MVRRRDRRECRPGSAQSSQVPPDNVQPGHRPLCQRTGGDRWDPESPDRNTWPPDGAPTLSRVQIETIEKED